MRALLAQTTSDAKGAIAAYYLGRPATPPLTLALEQAWGALSDPERLRVELNRLSPLERRVLDTIEELGGEVSTEELLEVEREPMRLRTTSGATPSRRGVGFAVERRGFLIPLHPNRHVIPSEVSAILSASVIAQRQATRARVRLGVEAEDHAPHRAQFSEDPGPLALAIVLAARELRGEVKAGVGTPRTLLSRIASRLGREGRPVAILTALSRTLGLWGTFTADEPTGLGALTLPELTAELFRVWRTGGSWDEAREDGEILRHPPEIREASPIGHLKQAVLDALSELGEGRWVPLSALLDFLGSDPREPGQARLVRRWSERIGADPVSLRTIAERILCETLPALGVVDLGLDQDAKVRLSSRGRALVQSRPVPTNEATTEFVDASVLRIGTRTPLGSVLALPPALEVGRVDKDISLLLDPQTLPNLLASGLDLDAFQAQLDALAPLPEGLRQAFAQANKVVGKGSLVATMGFLWVDQRELRDLLREHRNTADLFVDPSPPGGLLVKAGVEVDRLVKRCRSLGVEVHHENEVLLASSSRERSRRRR
jgi:hypothetical protein